MPLYNQSAMQAHEDTLALLTSAPQKTNNRSVENLLSLYRAQEDCNPSCETPETAERKTILEELSEILHLRGSLQQMGATFSDNGELLTYGNPPSPPEFEAMIRLGPLYYEQWNSFFVESYVPPSYEGANAHLWAGVQTLKKLLRNEGVAFGRQHQRYSFGDSSIKLRRLCCAYDELRNRWLAMLRTNLPAHDDAQLATLLEEASSEDDSESGDDVAGSREGTVVLDTNGSQDIADRPRTWHQRSSSTPHTIGWRFSDDSTSPSRCNAAWRFSNNLNSVPVWEDVIQANVEVHIALETVPLNKSHGSENSNTMPDVNKAEASRPLVPSESMIHGSSPLQNTDTQSMIVLDPTVSNPGIHEVLTEEATDAIWVQGADKDHAKGKKWGRMRRWFRHALGRK